MCVCLGVQIVETEREKRDSETEHRRVLDRCNAVLEEYRAIERKLRPHIVKSRPYYEERWQSSQRLNVSELSLCVYIHVWASHVFTLVCVGVKKPYNHFGG